MVKAEQLTRLGLTSYEAKAYLALIRRDSSTAAQVARLAEVPRQRIYDVLASLVEKGLAVTRPGQVVKYAATAPELALERLVSDHRQELAELERQTAAIIEELSPAFHAGKGQSEGIAKGLRVPHVHRVSGPSQADNHPARSIKRKQRPDEIKRCCGHGPRLPDGPIRLA